jgi:hypothetical protein
LGKVNIHVADNQGRMEIRQVEKEKVRPDLQQIIDELK